MNSQQNRLLIVDDNDLNRDMLARRLERKGYHVDVMAGGKGLTERVQRERFDLILLDIEMPEVSGLEALQKNRQI